MAADSGRHGDGRARLPSLGRRLRNPSRGMMWAWLTWFRRQNPWLKPVTALCAAVLVVVLLGRTDQLISGSQVTRWELVEEGGRILRILRPLLQPGVLSADLGPWAQATDLPRDLTEPCRWVLAAGLLGQVGNDLRFRPANTAEFEEVIRFMEGLQRYVVARLRHRQFVAPAGPLSLPLPADHPLAPALQALAAIDVVPWTDQKPFDPRRRLTIQDLRRMGQAMVEYFSRDLAVLQIAPEGIRVDFKGTIRAIPTDGWRYRTDRSSWQEVPVDGMLPLPAGLRPGLIELSHDFYGEMEAKIGPWPRQFFLLPLRRRVPGDASRWTVRRPLANQGSTDLVERLRVRLRGIRQEAMLARADADGPVGSMPALEPAFGERTAVSRSAGRGTTKPRRESPLGLPVPAADREMIASVEPQPSPGPAPIPVPGEPVAPIGVTQGDRHQLPRIKALRDRLHAIVTARSDSLPGPMPTAVATARPAGSGIAAPVAGSRPAKVWFEGVVNDSLTQRPIADANVLVERQVLATDRMGVFACNLPAEGLVDVVIAADGYQTLSMKHQASSDGPLPVFSLRPYVGHLSGVVVDAASGKPVVGATLRLAARKTVTGERGEFAFSRLKPGYDQVVIEREGFLPTSALTYITAGNTRRQFRLHPEILASRQLGEPTN